MSINKKIEVEILKEDTGYSCTTIIDNNFIGVEAETREELLREIITAVNFTFENQGYIYSADDFTFSQVQSGFFLT